MTPLEQQSRRTKLFINLIIFLIAIISFSRRDGALSKTSLFENFMIDSFAPVQRSVFFISDRVNYFFAHYVSNITASKRNIVLSKRVEELEGRLFQYQEVVKENSRLKKLLAFGEELKINQVLAQIVARDSSSDYRVVRINKGHAHGIRLQAPVLTDKGLVGYVFRLTEHFADVMTILDQNNRVDVLVERTRSHGIVEGAENNCEMKYVSRTEPVIINDKVITSGLGNIYPKGILVGHITRIEREGYGITQSLEISPVVDFNRIEEVVVQVGDQESYRNKEWTALDKQDMNEGKNAR